MKRIWSSIVLASSLVTTAAHAQGVSAGVEVATDERRRGLSWSDGDPAASVDAAVSLGALDASVRAVTTRGSQRHAGADGVADLELGATTNLGAVRLRGHVTGHLFVDARASMDYVELGGTASYSLGPLQMNAGAVYAPDQQAIGGDNLYLFAGANAGIPMTPVSLSAAVGRSTGSRDDAVRAARLRPDGDYTDWRIGLEFTQFPFTLGVDYIGTDNGQRSPSPLADPRNSGDRVLARARFSF